MVCHVAPLFVPGDVFVQHELGVRRELGTSRLERISRGRQPPIECIKKSFALFARRLERWRFRTPATTRVRLFRDGFTEGRTTQVEVQRDQPRRLAVVVMRSVHEIPSVARLTEPFVNLWSHECHLRVHLADGPPPSIEATRVCHPTLGPASAKDTRWRAPLSAATLALDMRLRAAGAMPTIPCTEQRPAARARLRAHGVWYSSSLSTDRCCHG